MTALRVTWQVQYDRTARSTDEFLPARGPRSGLLRPVRGDVSDERRAGLFHDATGARVGDHGVGADPLDLQVCEPLADQGLDLVEAELARVRGRGAGGRRRPHPRCRGAFRSPHEGRLPSRTGSSAAGLLPRSRRRPVRANERQTVARGQTDPDRGPGRLVGAGGRVDRSQALAARPEKHLTEHRFHRSGPR